MTPRNLGYRIPQQELERLTQLSRISDLLNRSLAGDDGFEQLLKTLLEMLPAERAFVLLEVGGPARIAASCSRTDKGILDDAPFEYSEVMLGAVLSLGEALLLTDASADVRYRNCERVRSTGVRSVLCVPLRGPQGYLGAVYLDNRREAGAFDRSHLEWLGIVADLAGSALERARYLSELKILVEERTRERDQAEQAALAKSAFLANMSHEIRTPMNGVLGMARLAQQCDASPVLQSYLGIIVNSAESLLDILNDILDFSKLEAGLLDYDPAPFQLRELIDSALKTVALKAHEKGLELVCSVDRRIPDRLTTDPTRLRQVLINLLGNAIKFTENGEILLQVVSYRGSEEELELQFSVKDTGIGIPHDKLDAIFKAFAQADVSTTRRYGGTGLGLSICSRLVSMMGGSLWVESEPGEGSNFHFTTTCNIMNGAWEPLGAGAPDIRGKSVLILDDNATNRKILEQMVRGWGMLPQLAASAREALELLDRTYKDGRHFDVILSDVHMPDQDGFEFLEELARKPYRDELGVVMMLTSAALSGDAKRCKDLGASSYLIKPIGEEQLLSTVLSHLDAAHFEQMRVQSSPRARRTLQPAARPRDVLLVEDNLINQTVGIALLETCGHRVTVASNGGEAVEAASRHRFDAVLMDLQMPDMDGLEATRLIRNLDGPLARVPIFALTAHVTEDHRQDCLKGGMDGFLTKPIQEDSILALLETLPRTRASQ